MFLKGKSLFITGANGALGKAAAKMASRHGASRLVLVDITADIDTQQIEGSATIECHSLDLSDAKATEQLFAELGPIDAVFNIAGGFDMGQTSYEVSDEQWQAMFNINVSTMQNVIRACVPHMLSQGSGAIVNIGALGALQGQGLMSAYTASKSVVMRLTESLSAEVKSSGINVNAVLPNVIDTPRNRADMPDADYTQWVDPEDLANMICVLGSDLSRAVHGALVPISGLG